MLRKSRKSKENGAFEFGFELAGPLASKTPADPAPPPPALTDDAGIPPAAPSLPPDHVAEAQRGDNDQPAWLTGGVPTSGGAPDAASARLDMSSFVPSFDDEHSSHIADEVVVEAQGPAAEVPMSADSDEERAPMPPAESPGTGVAVVGTEAAPDAERSETAATPLETTDELLTASAEAEPAALPADAELVADDGPTVDAVADMDPQSAADTEVQAVEPVGDKRPADAQAREHGFALAHPFASGGVVVPTPGASAAPETAATGPDEGGPVSMSDLAAAPAQAETADTDDQPDAASGESAPDEQAIGGAEDILSALSKTKQPEKRRRFLRRQRPTDTAGVTLPLPPADHTVQLPPLPTAMVAESPLPPADGPATAGFDVSTVAPLSGNTSEPTGPEELQPAVPALKIDDDAKPSVLARLGRLIGVSVTRNDDTPELSEPDSTPDTHAEIAPEAEPVSMAALTSTSETQPQAQRPEADDEAPKDNHDDRPVENAPAAIPMPQADVPAAASFPAAPAEASFKRSARGPRVEDMLEFVIDDEDDDFGAPPAIGAALDGQPAPAAESTEAERPAKASKALRHRINWSRLFGRRNTEDERPDMPEAEQPALTAPVPMPQPPLPQPPVPADRPDTMQIVAPTAPISESAAEPGIGAAEETAPAKRRFWQRQPDADTLAEGGDETAPKRRFWHRDKAGVTDTVGETQAPPLPADLESDTKPRRSIFARKGKVARPEIGVGAEAPEGISEERDGEPDLSGFAKFMRMLGITARASEATPDAGLDTEADPKPRRRFGRKPAAQPDAALAPMPPLPESEHNEAPASYTEAAQRFAAENPAERPSVLARLGLTRKGEKPEAAAAAETDTAPQGRLAKVLAVIGISTKPRQDVLPDAALTLNATRKSQDAPPMPGEETAIDVSAETFKAPTARRRRWQRTPKDEIETDPKPRRSLREQIKGLHPDEIRRRRVQRRMESLPAEELMDAGGEYPALAPQSFGESVKSNFNKLLRIGETVGLDIGSANLRAVIVRNGSVTAVKTHPLPPGIIVDGLLANPAGLTRELRAMWQDSLLSSREVNFSISNRAVALRTLQLAAAANPADLELAVAVNAETVLQPMNVNNSIIDYAELSRAANRVSLQLAAADKQMVTAFVKAVQNANLVPLSCEIGPVATGRALHVPRMPHSAHGVIEIGAEKTTFICASGADIFFLRVVDIGGNDFTRAIQQRFQIRWEQAEQLKLRCGLLPQPVDPKLAETPELFAACQNALQQVADHLNQELAGTPQFFSQLQEGRPVKSLTVLGGGSRLVGLTEQIAMFINVEDAYAGAKPRPDLDVPDDFDLYAPAIGLALDHTMSLMPDVAPKNFSIELPGRRRKPKVSGRRTKTQARRLRAAQARQRSFSPNTIVIVVAMIIAVAGFFYGHHIKGENTTLQQTIAAQGTTTQPTLPPTYSNSPLATSVAGMVFATPNWQTLAAIESSAATNGTTIKSITESATPAGQVTITGKSSNPTGFTSALGSVTGVSNPKQLAANRWQLMIESTK